MSLHRNDSYANSREPISRDAIGLMQGYRMLRESDDSIELASKRRTFSRYGFHVGPTANTAQPDPEEANLIRREMQFLEEKCSQGVLPLEVVKEIVLH